MSTQIYTTLTLTSEEVTVGHGVKGGPDLGWRQMKKKQGDDYRLDLTLSLEQDQTMTPLEASASLSQGFEAVDSPRT